MAETAACVECGATIERWRQRCPQCGYRPELPTSVRVLSVLLAFGAAIAGLVALGAAASVIVGDRSLTTIIGAVVFAGVTIAAVYAIYALRSRGPTRATDPPE